MRLNGNFGAVCDSWRWLVCLLVYVRSSERFVIHFLYCRRWSHELHFASLPDTGSSMNRIIWRLLLILSAIQLTDGYIKGSMDVARCRASCSEQVSWITFYNFVPSWKIHQHGRGNSTSFSSSCHTFWHLTPAATAALTAIWWAVIWQVFCWWGTCCKFYITVIIAVLGDMWIPLWELFSVGGHVWKYGDMCKYLLIQALLHLIPVPVAVILCIRLL